MAQLPLIQQRNLVLLPFPFSDQSGKKVRPVIILSNSSYNTISQDVIVIAVTSNISLPNSVLITNDDLVEGFLKTNSCAKVDSVLKIHQSLIIKNIGRISVEKYKRIITKFDSLIELEIDQIEKEVRSNNQNVD